MNTTTEVKEPKLLSFFDAMIAMQNGKKVYRQGSPGKIMKWVTPENWDGLFPISSPMVVIEGGETWCGCASEIQANDYIIVE